MAIDKIYKSFDEAVADIPDGSVILLGGFGPADGVPSYLIRALAKQGAKNLTLVCNTPGHGRDLYDKLKAEGRAKTPPNYDDGALLVKNGQVTKAICSFPTSPWPGAVNPLMERFAAGEVEIEMTPQGTLAERIRAAKAGISAFYTPTSAGTILEKGKETRLFDDTQNVLEYAIKADFALIKAHKADRWGNLVYRGTSRNFNPVMAGAAKVTIVEAEHVVPLGELDPDTIVTPSIYVNRVVARPKAGKGD